MNGINKMNLLVLALLLLVSAAQAGEVEINKWLVAGPVAVHHTSLDPGMDADPVKLLLDTPPVDPVDFWPSEGDPFSIRPGKRVTFREDKARLPLHAVPEGTRLAVLATYLATPAWQEGSIAVESEAPFALFVNGTSAASRATMDEDSEEVSADVILDQGHTTLMIVAALPDGEDLSRWELKVTYSTGDDSEVPDNWMPAVTTDPVHPYDLIDYHRMEAVSSLQLSPDGRWLALDLSQREPVELSANDRLEVWDTRTGELAWSYDAAKGANNLAWSPDSKKLLFASGDELFVYDHLSNSVDRIGDKPEKGGGFRWAGNTGLFYTRTVEAPENDNPYKVMWGLEDRWGGWRDDAALHHLNLESMADTRLLSMKYGIMGWDVSKSGDQLVIVRSIPAETRPYDIFEVLNVDLNKGTVDTVYHDKFRLDWDLSLSLHPNGKLLAFTGPSQKGMNADPITEFVNTNEIHLYTMDLGSGEVSQIHPDFPMSINNGTYVTGRGNSFDFREDGTLVFTGTYLRKIHLCTWKPGDTMIDARLLEPNGISNLSIATDSRSTLIAYQGDQMDDVPNVYSWDLATNKGGMIVELNAELRRVTDPAPRVEWYDYVNSDGVTIYGYLYYPRGYEKNGSFPLVVDTYGGVIGFGDSWLWMSQVMANRGYFVYVPVPRGASGYGQEYADTHVNDWGVLTSRDMNEGVRHIVANVDGVDGDAIGFASGSYGGFLAMYLLAMDKDHPDYYPYATTISDYGISNLASYWGVGWWGVHYSEMASAGSFPWNRPDWYISQSPLYHADNITAPLLLIHGDSDINVPVGESEQMFSALKLLNRDVAYVMWPDEGHGIVNDRTHYVTSKRMHVEWFDKQLRNRPGAWDHRMKDEYQK